MKALEDLRKDQLVKRLRLAKLSNITLCQKNSRLEGRMRNMNLRIQKVITSLGYVLDSPGAKDTGYRTGLKIKGTRLSMVKRRNKNWTKPAMGGE